jgi:hypothetical protein
MKQRSPHAGDEAKIIACMAMKQRSSHAGDEAKIIACRR